MQSDSDVGEEGEEGEEGGAGAVPSLTYIGGFLLSQLKFLLGIFKSLGVLVQLILSSLQLLLQSYQIVLKLRPVAVPRNSLTRGDQAGAGESGGGGGRSVCATEADKTHGDTERRRTAQRRRQDRTEGREREKLGESVRGSARYLGCGLLRGQQLLLGALELLKHFISLVLSYAQFLFHLSYILL